MNVWKLARYGKPILGAVCGALVLVWLAAAAPALGAGAPHDGARAQVSSPQTYTGASLRIGIDEGGTLNRDQATVALGAGTGAGIVRASLWWAGLEPTQGVYDWTNADIYLNRLTDAGLSPVVFITNNPKWAANTPCGPIDTKDQSKIDAFANIMTLLAQRYPKIQTWALYNEVDDTAYRVGISGGCFGSFDKGGLNNNGRNDYEDYAIMLATAWNAVHNANSKARLYMGSVALDGFDPRACPPQYDCRGGVFNYKFLPNLFKYMSKHPLASGKKYADGGLFNYFEIYGPWWETQAGGHGIQAKAAAVRKMMTDAKIKQLPLVVSETGVTSNKDADGVGVAGQNRCVDITMVRGLAAKLKGIIWWTFQDDPTRNWYYGLVDINYKPKQSYKAMQTLTAELNGYKFKRNQSNAAGLTDIEAYQFANKSLVKYVVWSNSIKTSTYKPGCAWKRNSRVATFAATKLRVVSPLGVATIIKDNRKGDLDSKKGSIAIKATGDPKFVQINP